MVTLIGFGALSVGSCFTGARFAALFFFAGTGLVGFFFAFTDFDPALALVLLFDAVDGVATGGVAVAGAGVEGGVTGGVAGGVGAVVVTSPAWVVVGVAAAAAFGTSGARRPPFMRPSMNGLAMQS